MKSAADRWANGAKWPAPLLRPSPDALLEMRISIYQSGYIRHHQKVISLYGKDKVRWGIIFCLHTYPHPFLMHIAQLFNS
jgi:hypothetical protein